MKKINIFEHIKKIFKIKNYEIQKNNLFNHDKNKYKIYNDDKINNKSI